MSWEGETEVFKIKRSSHSRRVAKQMKKELKEKTDPKSIEIEADIGDSTSEKEKVYEEQQRERRKKDVYDEEEARVAAEKIKVG